MTSFEASDSGNLAAWFASLAVDLHAEPEEQPTVERIVAQAREVVGGHWCGITLRRRRGRLETVASTHPTVDEVDRLQYALREGPCHEPAKEGVAVVSRDTARDPRWPRWGPQVADLGVRSVLSLHLVVPQADDVPQVLGAVNVYDSRLGAFSGEDLDRGLIFAVHAARALATAQQVEGLEAATHSRHTIGIAQGILMQRYGLTMEGSFEAMRRYSSESNIKLRDLAREVIAARHLPDALPLDDLPVDDAPTDDLPTGHIPEAEVPAFDDVPDLPRPRSVEQPDHSRR